MISSIVRILAGTAIAAAVISTGLSEAATNGNQYMTAITIPGDSGESLARLSSDAYAAGEKKIARDLALKALGKSLAHVEALRTVGITDFEAGKEETGLRLVKISGEMSWRDSAGQAWLLQQALLGEDYGTAIKHTDALLRRRKVQEEIFSIFNLAGQEPKLSEPLKAQFANMPNWRENFFATRKNTPAKQYDGFEGLVRALKDSPAPATRREMTPYVNLLISKGQESRALSLWTEFFPEDGIAVESGKMARLSWPTGERVDKPLPFDWRLSTGRSIFASVEEDGNGNPMTLDLELDRRAIGDLTWRNLRIASGTARLTADVDGGALRDMHDMRWSLTCLGTEGNKQYFRSNGPAQNGWTIPVSGTCSAYRLALETPLGGVSSAKRLRIGAITLSVD
ncbi:hypothetical protein [Sphingorhabdus sp. Alg239-R122]|uniref:hypothetical protein n=1 Tax=Sphingorhabdus sp. Alg239-R122 TaxID=2305989 RepID=UPI0013DA1453|nr:hypothetical protein [Sphingorhabdus sp. Alg239-R122]